ncbi:histone RNA hairpin-binding protein-like [Amphibalanus amphitrite]|uniref:histone RNA hairpin-binding protein-like n=1 Tax=Amphibalanus amphitrite TaxID=1232801 RepID=UPI001C909DAF|nr:histone RNA hairpin-binding protein-like [Amphibalanus amphitrite]XP_043197238.1 histone RNA hairpin-binding protein-like [Amphibalanus amphitrite]
MVHPHTPERRHRDSSVSSWPNREHPMPSPGASPSSTASPLVSPGVSPAGAVRRSPRKGSRPVRTPQFVVEDDPVILARRQKQIEYGKNTLAYQQYTAAVPRAQRLGYHPRTPVKRRVQSRRRWDNAVRCWRVHLHYWNDPAKLAELRGQESASDTSSVVSDPAETGSAPEAAGEHGAEAAAETGAAAEGSEAEQMGQGDPDAAAAEKEDGEEAFDWAAEVEEVAMELAG